MTDKQKPIKPILLTELYAVIKRSGTHAVTLASDFSRVQFTGARDYCLMWARSNSPGFVGEWE